MKLLATVLLFAGVVVSCAPSTKIVKIMQKTNDKPAAYQNGFMNGCGSGFQQSGLEGYLFFKDLQRYQSEEQYKEGWLAGFKKCS